MFAIGQLKRHVLLLTGGLLILLVLLVLFLGAHAYHDRRLQADTRAESGEHCCYEALRMSRAEWSESHLFCVARLLRYSSGLRRLGSGSSSFSVGLGPALFRRDSFMEADRDTAGFSCAETQTHEINWHTGRSTIHRDPTECSLLPKHLARDI